jgi:hypothetical protein
MFLKELFAYIISGEFSMKFSMEKEQTITRFSDCAHYSNTFYTRKGLRDISETMVTKLRR